MMKKARGYIGTAACCLLFLFLMLPCISRAANGDTIVVKTFRFGSQQDSVFLFPSDTIRFEKILMLYTLRCPKGGPCGEWDYLTYTYLYKPTGKTDSNLVTRNNFQVNNKTVDTFAYISNPGWIYTWNAVKGKPDSVQVASQNLRILKDTTYPELGYAPIIKVWAPYYRYTFDASGKKTDSALVGPDFVLYRKNCSYFNRYKVNEPFELARYITPYGNGLSLGAGFTWVYDVSDYRTLLHDSVHLSAGNWQEELEMTFLMIKGIPPRDIKSIRNLWNGYTVYTTPTSPDKVLAPMNIVPETGTSAWRLKLRSTGHGFGDKRTNCAEFCPRNHKILLDGTEKFNILLFRDNCALNPVYPQGGTWAYSRAAWCPGAEVRTYDMELTPYLKSGQGVTLDYNIDTINWTGPGTQPYYMVETQLVSYGPPNFTNDAGIEEILSPSAADMYKRMNPICNGPQILIKNNGSEALTSLDISYGKEGGTASVYHWTGNLSFLDTIRVTLGVLDWTGGGRFKVSLSNPNGKPDEYASNNSRTTSFVLPPSFPNRFIIDLRTNKAAGESSYTLRDAGGQLIRHRTGIPANIIIKDTLDLRDNCYTFILSDSGGNGLNWWAAPGDGAGTFMFRKTNGGGLKTYNMDFGAEIYQQFSVGKFENAISEEVPLKAEIEVFPNPNNGHFSVDIQLNKPVAARLSVTDIMGRTIYAQGLGYISARTVSLSLPGMPPGVYIVRIQAGEIWQCKKIILGE